ncbi:glycosyltransferase family 2 protein [Oceanobacillus polygoni]|uniref:Glycosyltransferase involved in cell wall biosynthesis n=2 Tax=Oceanobacillus polygoni TaxID=1235259 RepID=A0A9X1CEI4_9BACI|nr:glycosyltransferase family A protein [Oceanobacillus polygoni]MBP2076167.1 glycosyltransferase involved in cell wall biosynthesis [Oceanobacillus polygoni]
MMKKQTEMNKPEEENTALTDQLAELEAELEKKSAEKKANQQRLMEYKHEFMQAQHLIKNLAKYKREGKSIIRSIPAYVLGRRNIKQVYSKAYKRKHAENQLKKYKKYLYDLGFIEKALSDLQQLFVTTSDYYLRKAIAWELALWYANKLTEDSADMVLKYMAISMDKEKNQETLRKAAILKAESYELLGEQEKGMRFITNLLVSDKHADLYVAAANLERTIEGRVDWINKCLRLYQLQEITLSPDDTMDAYYRLRTNPIQKKHATGDGPKVSIIIPAYNSESGIRVAIESMLAQTWDNLEILVVDDCSTDDTANVIAEYAEMDARVKQLTTPKNSGPYIARNIALQQATGEFVTINDADDWSHPEKIERQVNHLMEQKDIIANTSEHARLTEELKPYRRGMPGRYIFSNMSSIMFRRKPVLEKVGYWDRVRFAADSEFKNRLIAVFGKESVVDLKTGPLSFPMQSSGSLTASSAFGYNGFLMGTRKEYAEAYRLYHKQTDTFYMPFEPESRLYPVPEPMWPEREEKQLGKRHFDIVFISDFRSNPDQYIVLQVKALQEMGMRTGLIQMGQYDLKMAKAIEPSIRKLIDGNQVQMLVYGESISCDVLIVNNPAIFEEKQVYVPKIHPKVVRVIVNQPPLGSTRTKNYDLRKCSRHIAEYVHTKSKWYPINEKVRDNLLENHRKELKSIPLSTENWMSEKTWNQVSFASFIENWLVDENPFKLE